jgi:CheY-like chemotaxis protein
VNFKERINLSDNITVFTDEIKIKQILVNLLSNSIKFTKHGHVLLGIEYENENIKFSVEDTGLGIPDEIMKNLFSLYVKNSDENNKLGAGLGLNIVADLTNKLGSKINFESKVGEGSKFWFFIPPSKFIHESKRNVRFSSNNVEMRKESSSRMNSLKETTIFNFNFCLQEDFYKKLAESKNICNPISTYIEEDSLVINIIITDDEKLIRQSTKRILTNVAKDNNINLNCIEATDGIETLYMLYKYLSDGIAISGIISDETMNYLNGVETYNLLKRICEKSGLPMIPFVIATAYETKLGDDNCLYQESKPLDGNKAKRILEFFEVI